MVHHSGVDGCTHCHGVCDNRAAAPPKEEYVIQLELMMVDQPGQLCPPPFSWNVEMVLHVLKNDSALRELKYVKVNGPGMAYLFFYDRCGHHGLTWEAAQMVCSHMWDTFSEWIGWPTQFEALLLPLDEGHHHTTEAQDRH